MADIDQKTTEEEKVGIIIIKNYFSTFNFVTWQGTTETDTGASTSPSVKESSEVL